MVLGGLYCDPSVEGNYRRFRGLAARADSHLLLRQCLFRTILPSTLSTKAFNSAIPKLLGSFNLQPCEACLQYFCNYVDYDLLAAATLMGE